MESQKQKILNLLTDSTWVCTSQMYALYMSDPRRRIVDLKKDGYILESRKCQSHDYHRGGSKEWHLIGREEKKEESEFQRQIWKNYAEVKEIRGIEMPQGIPFRVKEILSLKEIKQEALF